MVDQILLNDTLQKINASLNRRFEKDANLYISRQDEYEIKKNLCHGAYGGVVDMAKAKGISNDIIVKVIMRNAGVLNVKDLERFKRVLKPILENANYKVLSYMMEDVLGNSVYMQKDFRHVLFTYYMSGITAISRINYWKRGTFELDEDERTTLFRLIIEKTRQRDPSKTLDFKLEFIQDAFTRYKSLLKEEDVYVKLKETLDDRERKAFFRYLCKEMESPSINDEAYNVILMNGYASYGEEAFQDVVGKIRESSPANFKQYIKVIGTLFWMEKDKTTLTRMFDTIRKVYESPYIKSHIKREIGRKVWKAAKSNEVLYEERKLEIEGLLSSIEQTDTAKYASFADVYSEILGNVNPISIAFFWINMKSPDFEQSILDSMKQSDEDYLWSMSETYSWLFEHSLRKKKIGGLKKLCERLAKPLQEFHDSGESSEFYNTLDNLWVNRVVKYKLKGPVINRYMFDNHYDQVKEWE